MRRFSWFVSAAVATAGAGTELWAVNAGWAWSAAVLDLLAGWSLLAAAAWAGRLGSTARLLLAASSLAWFLATPEVVGGAVGEIAALLGALWFAPLVAALLSSPDSRPRSARAWVAVGGACLHAVPDLAGIGRLTATVGAGVAVVAAVDLMRSGPRGARTAALLIGVVVGAAGALTAIGSEPLLLPRLVPVGVVACALILVVRPADATTIDGAAGLILDVGRSRDAFSLQRRLGAAVGDPELRLLYRLGAELLYVDVDGVPVTPDPGRTVTVIGRSGRAVAVLEHDRRALDDPQLRIAILAAGSLTVRRLDVAAEAAERAVELGESRRRIVEAETLARAQFAEDVARGPERALARCLAALDAASGSAPPGLRSELAAARSAGDAARSELAASGRGDVRRLLGRRGVGGALAGLAAASGARAEVATEGLGLRDHGDDGGPGVGVSTEVAVAAWFAASELLTNALKHAGPARIRLAVTAAGEQLRLEVTDDGRGGADPDGPGLLALRRRLAEHAGRLLVTDAVPSGTRALVLLPMHAVGRSTAAAGAPQRTDRSGWASQTSQTVPDTG